jgi:protocatechuate 3,4-dioxygenase beta subunit
MGKKAKREQAAAPAANATPQAATTAKQATREKLEFTTEQILEATRSVGHPAVSREISDKLGIKDPDQGRAYIRARMAALVKDKKIVTSEPDGKSRATFLYSVVEA